MRRKGEEKEARETRPTISVSAPIDFLNKTVPTCRPVSNTRHTHTHKRDKEKNHTHTDTDSVIRTHMKEIKKHLHTQETGGTFQNQPNLLSRPVKLENVLDLLLPSRHHFRYLRTNNYHNLLREINGFSQIDSSSY